MKKLWLLSFSRTFRSSLHIRKLPSMRALSIGLPRICRLSTKRLPRKLAGDSHRAASTPLSDYSNELFMLAHREADGQPELHETQ